MMNLQKALLVARYEYVQNFQRKSFLFTAFLMPLIIMGSIYIGIQFASPDEDDLNDYQQVGYVDQSGVLANFADEEFERFVPYASEAEARAAYDAKTVNAYLVLPADYLQTGSITYFSAKAIPLVLREEIDNFLSAGVAASADSTGHPIERLRNPMNTKLHILGETEQIEEEDAIARFLVPLVFVMLLSITVLTTAQFLMSGVVEEKENRVAEILLTSATPGELMLGKLLGLGGLALTQVIYMVVLGLVVGSGTGRLELLQQANYQPVDILLTFVYFLLSFVLFSGIMLAIGASVSAEPESRQFAAIFSILFIAPVYATPILFNDPQGTISTALSLFPFTAPVSTLMLLSAGEVRVWQVVLSITIMLLTIAFVLWAATKIFRRGILMYDQRLNLRQLASIVRGRS